MPKETTKKHGPGQEWRSIPLSIKVSIPNVHPHVLFKFKSESDDIQDSARKTLKSDGDKPSEQKDENESSYEEDEGKWQCNGTVNFVDGCKSGQTEFDFHQGTEAWQSLDRNLDFDLCEMCIRWAIHCQKTGTDLGWVEETPANDPGENLVSEPYLTERE